MKPAGSMSARMRSKSEASSASASRSASSSAEVGGPDGEGLGVVGGAVLGTTVEVESGVCVGAAVAVGDVSAVDDVGWPRTRYTALMNRTTTRITAATKARLRITGRA